jgi:hypothetical protein
MRIQRHKRFIYFLLIICLFSCTKDDPIIPNEEEIITSVIYTLFPKDGGTPILFSYRDLDGDGGNPPIITEAILLKNQSYIGKIELFNELVNPPKNISQEVLAEAEEHQFFYVSNLNYLEIKYNDQDKNGLPIGLETIVNTNVSGNSALKIILKHQPNKTGINVSSGSIINAGGETDLEITFNINVQ